MTDTPYILRLSDIQDDYVVGGKAASLARLISRGMNVPNGFVITIKGHSVLMAEGNLGDAINDNLSKVDYDNPQTIESVAKSIEDLILNRSIPNKLLEALELAYSKIGEGPVAVRSSATAEDLPEASFAGQYETYLNVQGFEDLIQHIRKCYASLWSGRAISYRHTNSISEGEVLLAILVQALVPAKAAGVMFTRSPTGEEEIAIESNFGLGESVVDGSAVPDRYIVSRTPEGNHFVVSKEIGTKEVIIQKNASQGGTVVSKISPEMSEKASLEDMDVLRLAKMGIEIERIFGAPQDVEWAIDESDVIHILQSRPITTIEKKEEADEIVWSRGYSDDYWNDNVTPLFYDLLGDQIKHIVNVELNDIMGYQKMPDDVLKLYRAHAYFNLGVIRTKVVNEIPPFIRTDHLLNFFPEGGGPYGKETMRELPFALRNRILAEIRVMLFDPDGSMTRTDDAYREWTDETFLPYLEEFDKKLQKLTGTGNLGKLMDLADDIDKVMMHHFRLIRYGLPVHNLGMNLITQYLLRTFLGEDEAVTYYPLLISALEHKTTQTNRRLNELAERARNFPLIADIITSIESPSILQALKSHSDAEVGAFLDEFMDFLNEFGVRGYTRELLYPRWGESPELVFDILKPLISEAGKDVKTAEREALQRKIQAEAAVEEGIRSQRFGGIKWGIFSAILGLAQKYTCFREDQRFNLDRWITRNRALFLEIGSHLKEAGTLSDASRIFFLHRKELKKLIRGNLSVEKVAALSRLSEERYLDFKKNEDVTPPKFLCGSRAYNDPLPLTESDSLLVGIPASQGKVSGRVRVLRTIHEISNVRAGDILVVPRTDPGWTPVFSRIAGLITETGGILSHGAVVSREYGIPAVTNIRNACDLLKTGELVSIDGNKGTAVIHGPED
ncbi:MAG: PEP/pyruvate-binding domain-containing protein [Candidatus Hermodarchaeota archaeon]